MRGSSASCLRTPTAPQSTMFRATCFALDKPRSQGIGRFDLTEVNANVATLQQNLELFNLDSSSLDECPACDDDDDEETNRISRQILAKASAVILQTSTFARLKRVMRTRLGRRRYNKSVSPDSIVPIFNSTASHFAAFACHARGVKTERRSDKPAASPVSVELVALLEDVSTMSANVALELAGVIQVANRTTAGVVTVTALSMLDFLDRVSLGTTSLVVDYLSVLNGGTAPGIDTKAIALRASLSTNSTDRVFGEMLSFLNAIGDQSSLTIVLTKLTKNLNVLDNRLANLTSLANTFISTSVTSVAIAIPSRSASPNQTFAEMTNLVAGIMLTVMNSMRNIVQDGLSYDVAGTVRSALGLVLRSAESILNQSAMTTNALLTLVSSIFNSGALKVGDSTGVTGDTGLLLAILCAIVPRPPDDDSISDDESGYCAILILFSPLVWILVPFGFAGIVLSVVGNLLFFVLRPRAKSLATCPAKRLACQNKALSMALPSI